MVDDDLFNLFEKITNLPYEKFLPFLLACIYFVIEKYTKENNKDFLKTLDSYIACLYEKLLEIHTQKIGGA